MTNAKTRRDQAISTRSRVGGAFARALVFVVVVAMSLSASLAGANPEVKLEWISKGGVPIIPPNDTVVVTDADIAAERELVLRISLVLDAVQIHEFGFLLTFDDDLKDELDIPAENIPTEQSTYGPFDSIGFFEVFESDTDFRGEIGAYRGCVTGSVCDQEPETFGGTPVGNQTIVIDDVTFVPTVLATNDRRDVTIDNVPFNEEFRDASGNPIDFSEITLGHASVVPEPSQGLLAASAISTLAVLARKRSRSVA